MEAILHAVMPRLIEASWQAAAMVVIILVVQGLLRRSLSPRWRCAMWSLLFVRLLLPALPASPFSLENFRGERPSIASTIGNETTITFGVIPTNNDPGRRYALPRREAVPDSSARIDAFPALGAVWISIAFLLILRHAAVAVAFHRRLRCETQTSSAALL
ncbi:MAG: M56 family metallopeptidase, partial [Tepidisphaeraceae bacterium]